MRSKCLWSCEKFVGQLLISFGLFICYSSGATSPLIESVILNKLSPNATASSSVSVSLPPSQPDSPSQVDKSKSVDLAKVDQAAAQPKIIPPPVMVQVANQNLTTSTTSENPADGGPGKLPEAIKEATVATLKTTLAPATLPPVVQTTRPATTSKSTTKTTKSPIKAVEITNQLDPPDERRIEDEEQEPDGGLDGEADELPRDGGRIPPGTGGLGGGIGQHGKLESHKEQVVQKHIVPVESENNRLFYFVMFLGACIGLLMFWRKRQWILAYLIEGKRSQSRRRTPAAPSAHYRKLRNEGEEE